MIAIDLQTFSECFGGGKDQVAFNLLRGFQEIGVAENLIVYCNQELKRKIDLLCPDANVKILPDLFTSYKKMKFVPIRKIISFFSYKINSRIMYLFYKNEISTHHITTLLFTEKQSLLGYKIPCKTLFITHDIQIIIRNINNNLMAYMFRIQIKNSFKNTDTAICISDYDFQECKKRFTTDMVRIYNPIVFSDMYLDKLGLNYITLINYKQSYKNPITLIRAFSLIIDRLPSNVCLLFIGSLPMDYQNLVSEADKLQIKDRIIFSGYISEDEKERYLKSTRLVVNASLFEGFGMVAVEAMAMGIPCIVADNSAQRETTLGLCRYYSPAEDEKALSKAILEEFENPASDQERRSISASIRQAFDYRKIAKEYWNLLNK